MRYHASDYRRLAPIRYPSTFACGAARTIDGEEPRSGHETKLYVHIRTMPYG